MRHNFITLVFLCVMAAFGPTFAESIATVVAVQGTPKVTGPNGNRDLAANSAVFEKDKITVGSGNAQILFVDGTKLVVGPGSTLVIEKYLMRGGSSAQNFSINALRGTYRFITGKGPKSAYNIKTANATIGIRGTGFDFWVKKKTGVAVLDGKVKLCDSSTSKSKGCVDLNAGCEVGVVQPGQAELLKGFVKGNSLVSNLPYILDQSSLNSKFRLDTSGCEKALRLVRRDPRSGEGQDPREEQRGKD
jgi:FecR protein